MEVRMLVKEIMTRNVATIDIKSDVQQLSKKMLDLDIGSVIITDKKLPVGIVTERDIVRKIVSVNLKPNDISIKELMTTPLITIPSSEDVTDERAIVLAKDIAKKIETEMTYPGQIKVAVIRESRHVDYAK